MFSIIVSLSENNAIGLRNELLWKISDDLKRFKQITTGHTVIMGKNTYYSLPKRPLSNRRNIVISDIKDEKIDGCEVVNSIGDVIIKCDDNEENFIIGGGSIYKQFLPLCEKLYLTKIHKKFDGDVFFPDINYKNWKLISKEDIPFSDDLGFDYSYEIYVYKNYQNHSSDLI